MSDDALGELVNQLETTTGEGWESMASHSLGKGERYREHYGFVWRESEVEYAQGAVVFLDHDDVFAREPYSAVFRDVESGLELALANLHVVYGDSVGDRVPEVEALADYWGWLEEIYPGTPRLIAGDFNLEPDHEAWGLFEKLALCRHWSGWPPHWLTKPGCTAASMIISGTRAPACL